MNAFQWFFPVGKKYKTTITFQRLLQKDISQLRKISRQRYERILGYARNMRKNLPADQGCN
jgi:hypothetical protein